MKCTIVGLWTDEVESFSPAPFYDNTFVYWGDVPEFTDAALAREVSDLHAEQTGEELVPDFEVLAVFPGHLEELKGK